MGVDVDVDVDAMLICVLYIGVSGGLVEDEISRLQQRMC